MFSLIIPVKTVIFSLFFLYKRKFTILIGFFFGFQLASLSVLTESAAMTSLGELLRSDAILTDKCVMWERFYRFSYPPHLR